MTAPDLAAEVVAALPPLATTEETAACLRVSLRTLRRRIADGHFRTIRDQDAGGSRVLIPRTEVERYIRQRVAS